MSDLRRLDGRLKGRSDLARCRRASPCLGAQAVSDKAKLVSHSQIACLNILRSAAEISFSITEQHTHIVGFCGAYELNFNARPRSAFARHEAAREPWRCLEPGIKGDALIASPADLRYLQLRALSRLRTSQTRTAPTANSSLGHLAPYALARRDYRHRPTAYYYD